MVEKVNILDIGVLMFSTLLSICLGIGSYILFSISATDIIFVVIFGTILSYPLLKIVEYVIANNRYENIFELNRNDIPCGKILNFMLFIGLSILALFIYYNLADFLNIEYLPETNGNFTKIIVLIPIFYILTKNFNSILKVNLILSIFSVVIIAIDTIGVLGSFEFSNIEPLVTIPALNYIKVLIYYIGFNGISLAMLALNGKGILLNEGIEDKKKSINKTFLIVFIIANAIEFIIVLSCILSLGIEYIHIFRFPEYVLLKQFSLFNMLERVENVLALQFIFNSFSILSYIIYNIVIILPKHNKIKIYPIFVLIALYFLASIVFKNTIHFLSYMKNFFVIAGYIFIILPIIITGIFLHKNVNKNA